MENFLEKGRHDIQQNNIQHTKTKNNKHTTLRTNDNQMLSVAYAERHIFIDMLGVIVPSVVMPSVIMPSVIRQSVIMPSVIRPSVVICLVSLCRVSLS